MQTNYDGDAFEQSEYDSGMPMTSYKTGNKERKNYKKGNSSNPTEEEICFGTITSMRKMYNDNSLDSRISYKPRSLIYPPSYNLNMNTTNNAPINEDSLLCSGDTFIPENYNRKNKSSQHSAKDAKIVNFISLGDFQALFDEFEKHDFSPRHMLWRHHSIRDMEIIMAKLNNMNFEGLRALTVGVLYGIEYYDAAVFRESFMINDACLMMEVLCFQSIIKMKIPSPQFQTLYKMRITKLCMSLPSDIKNPFSAILSRERLQAEDMSREFIKDCVCKLHDRIVERAEHNVLRSFATHSKEWVMNVAIEYYSMYGMPVYDQAKKMGFSPLIVTYLVNIIPALHNPMLYTSRLIRMHSNTSQGHLIIPYLIINHAENDFEQFNEIFNSTGTKTLYNVMKESLTPQISQYLLSYICKIHSQQYDYELK